MTRATVFQEAVLSEVRQRVTAVNALLAAVYGEDTRLSAVLERLGASEQEIAHVRDHAVAEACSHVVRAVSVCFQDLRSGSRDFVVLSRRLGLDGDVATLQELGVELGVTRERVRQIEERARRKCQAQRSRDAVEASILEILASTRRVASATASASSMSSCP